MSSNLPTTEGPIFMNLGGRNRNMITEPFEEDEPEFPQYGEFKRQIEQMINTKTQSNMFRPEPHNKEIGSSAEEQELTRRFLRTDTNGNPDNTRPPCTPQDTKNYHNMVREQANQALADTIACDLYVSVLGRYRKAQMQTLIDDTETSARTRLTKIKTAHWRQVLDHVQIIISNYKQQWYKGQVPSQNLKSAMFNLNILQEINKQVNNFDPRQTFSGLDIATMMLPTLVGTEFNQMVREWKRDIRKNTQIDITEISDDIQNCFSIQNSVTNPDTYSFIINPKETNRTQIKDTYTEDRHRGRNNSNTRHQRQYNEADIQDIRDRAYREGKASNDERNNRSRSRDSPRTRQNSYAANREPTDQRQAPPNRNKLQKESPPESSTETTTNMKQQPKPLSAPKKKRKRPTSKPHAQTSILKQTTNIQQQQQTTTTKHNHTPNTEQNTHNNNAETQQQSIFTKERIMKVTTDTAIADSGTDIHITNTDTIKRMNLPTYTYENPISIKFGQGAVQTAYTYTWMGDILEEVAIIPNAPATLISMYAIATKGLTVSLNATRITITDEFTGNTVYNRYVDRPGLYFIDLNKFITIKAPKHLEQYKRMSAHAKRIQKVTINEEEEQDNTDERDNQKQHHTCLLATTQQEPPLSDITPSQKRATNQRIPTSVIKRILWLHKSTGHRGREALAQMVQSMTNAGEGVTADTVRRVYDHIQCTACELAKRNKASTQKGSGIHNNNPGHTISIDYIGKITPTSARGHTGQFIAEDRATNYLHEHPTKSKDADNLIQFLTNVLAFYRHNKWEVREIRTDKGSVEISEQVKQFLNKQQPPIVVISAAPRQQQQNPWERTAQTMIKGTGAVMTDQYTLGATYWDYATAFWVKGHNATPNDKTEGASPREIVTGTKPDAERDFKFPFGCPVTITNINGREGNTYDTINTFGIAIGSSDTGNGATKVIICGKETKPYFERLHVLPLKLYNRKITNDEREQLQPIYDISRQGTTATYKSPVTTNILHHQLEPIPGSSLGNSITDTATTMPINPEPQEKDQHTHRQDTHISADRHPLIGATIAKEFGDQGTFKGQIVSIRGNWFHVVYEDGDEEDMNLQQVTKTITSKHQLQPAQQAKQAQRQTEPMETVHGTSDSDDDISTNTATHAVYLSDINNLFAETNTNNTYAAKKVHTTDNPTLGQARKSEEWPKWKKAIHDEIIGNIEAKDTYTRVKKTDIPKGQPILYTKVELKIKYDSTNNYLKHKARLCILGNTEPKDGRDDYASTANGKLIGLLFAIAAHENLHLSGLDIEGAFLSADIDEDIYVCIKGDLVDEADDVYGRLNKSMYGLRRSPQLFQRELQTHIVSAGYTQSPDDQALYFKRGPSEGDIIFFLTHVDDFAIASSSDELREELYAALRTKYKIEENNLEHFIGINVAYEHENGQKYMTLAQPAHIDKIATFFNITEPYTAPKTPMSTTYLHQNEKNTSTTKEDTPTCTNKYRQGIGLVLYILKTKPTTAFAINILCTKTSNPKKTDWEALERVAKYIVGTKHQRLRFRVNNKQSRLQALEIIAYADASTACHEDNKPHTGFGFSLTKGGPLFYARSHKQPTVTLSSCEAELTATIDATCDIIWYRNILDSLGYTQTEPTTLYNDNASTITLGTAFSGNHKRIRQFTRNVHWMIQHVQNGTVRLAHIEGTANVADALTKPLGPSQFTPHAQQMLGLTKHAYSTTTVIPIAKQHLTTQQANDIWNNNHPGLKVGWETHKQPNQRVTFTQPTRIHYTTDEPPANLLTFQKEQ